MHKKNHPELELDLVFNCVNSDNLKKYLKNDHDNSILDYLFWKNVFILWIQTIIIDSGKEFGNLISKKKYFSLSFEIINNEEISNLNQKWLSKSGATDVLSFPVMIKEDYLNNSLFFELGDIFISLDMAYKQSLQYKHSLKKEMLFLASHGFLHLVGWDHKNDKELDRMLNFQEYLISQLN